MLHAFVDLAQVPIQYFLVFGLAARTTFALGESKQFADIGETQGDESRMANEPQATDIGLAIEAMATGMCPAVGARGLRDQADLLIVADSLDGKARDFSRFTD